MGYLERLQREERENEAERLRKIVEPPLEPRGDRLQEALFDVLAADSLLDAHIIARNALRGSAWKTSALNATAPHPKEER